MGWFRLNFYGKISLELIENVRQIRAYRPKAVENGKKLGLIGKWYTGAFALHSSEFDSR
jgi:hypothetical protein